MSTTILHYGSRGEQVKRLQRGLNANKFHTLRRKLAVDGTFGCLTGSACQQAKYWMGYAKDDLEPIAGQPLRSYLAGTRKLTEEMHARRKARIEKVPVKPLRLKALEVIRGELGTMEHGENRIKYNDWWGWGAVAYCVIGVSWAWVKVGSLTFKRGSRWAGTDVMLEDAKHGRNGIHLTNDPRPGCPGVIDFSGHADPDHALTYESDGAGGMCNTIEFNTGGPSGVEGVWRKDRPLRNCWWMEVEK